MGLSLRTLDALYESNASGQRAGLLVPDGEQWGLARFATLIRKETQRTLTLLGQKDTDTVYIKCLDRDLRKVAFCQLWIHSSEGIFRTFSLPSKEVPNWEWYRNMSLDYVRQALQR